MIKRNRGEGLPRKFLLILVMIVLVAACLSMHFDITHAEEERVRVPWGELWFRANIPRPYIPWPRYPQGNELLIDGEVSGLCDGRISKEHGNVSIWWGSSREGPWTFITSFPIKPDPSLPRIFRFSYKWNAPALPVGTYYVRVLWTVDTQGAHVVKEQIIPFIVHDYSIFVKVEGPAYVGKPIKITGKLTKGDEPVADALIHFHRRPIPPGATNLKDLFGGIEESIVRTGSDGSFSVQWIPPATGDFSLTFSYWIEDGLRMQIMTVVAVSVLEASSVSTPKGTPIFVVSSDSAILSGLSYDSASNVLSFVATAPEGTKGKVFVYVSKDLVVEPPKFNVVVDGKAFENFTVEQVTDGYLLTITLSFSTRRIDVHLGPMPGTQFDIFSYALPLSVIVASCVLTLLIVKLVRGRLKGHAGPQIRGLEGQKP
jgi:hypothetical protein